MPRPRNHRRVSALTIAGATLVASLATLAPHAATAATPRSDLRFATVVKGSNPGAAAPHSHASLPAYTRRRSAVPAKPASALPISAAHRLQPSPRTARPSTLGTPNVLEQLQTFTGISVAEEGFNVTPPDTQLAVGPTAVVEMTNTDYLLMGRHGEGRAVHDLYAFWSAQLTAAGPGYDLSDPRVLYDPGSGRFYASILIFSATSGASSWVGVAASDTTDPGGSWHLWSFQSAANTLDDQPTLGVTSDKVVVSWNGFNATNTNYIGAQFLVVDKGDVDAAAVAPMTHLGPLFANAQSLVPAAVASTSTAYLVYNVEDLNNLTWSQVGVVPVTGQPDASGSDTTAVQSTHLLTLQDNGQTVTVSAPDFVEQPNNGHLLDPADGRMQSVVLNGGILYTAGSVAIQTGPSTFVSGLLTERITVSNWAFDWAPLASDTESIFDPAVVVDGNGLSIFSFTRSGSQRFASADAVSFDWVGSPVDAGVIASGVGHGDYACGSTQCELFTSPAPVERWGDYSAIALDPTNSDDVWSAAEFAPSTGANWGTAIARLTMSAPKLTGTDVSQGLTHGGTAVTITGADFDPLNTVAFFGGARAQSVRWLDPEHVLAIAPPHRPGHVDVVVSTPDGTAALPGAFNYLLPPRSGGYWMDASDGGIFPYGTAVGWGSHGGSPLNQPMVGMAPTADGGGYWLVAADGGIFPYGTAVGWGSHGGSPLNKPIVGMAATLDGGGYWLVASDGGIFPYGNAGGYGSTGNIHLNQPIVGMAPTPTGHGYWLVASDGGIFPFGDAVGWGSHGGSPLNKPIVGMAATTDGGGYWLVASDGGIFPYGDAVGWGSHGGAPLNQPIVGMAQSGDDGGYWMVAADGGIFPYGDAVGRGSHGGAPLNKPIVGMAASQP